MLNCLQPYKTHGDDSGDISVGHFPHPCLFPLPPNGPFMTIKRPLCRWCHGSTRPLSTNGIIGPGYKEGNYVCTECGKVQ